MDVELCLPMGESPSSVDELCGQTDLSRGDFVADDSSLAGESSPSSDDEDCSRNDLSPSDFAAKDSSIVDLAAILPDIAFFPVLIRIERVLQHIEPPNRHLLDDVIIP